MTVSNSVIGLIIPFLHSFCLIPFAALHGSTSYINNPKKLRRSFIATFVV